MVLKTIKEESLVAIGDAIREKTGKTELLTLDQMPVEIAGIETGGGGNIEIEPIVLTGECNHFGSGPLSSTTIKLFGDKITTNNLTNIENMFYNSNVTNIPFQLNCKSSQYGMSCSNLFARASKLEDIPVINGAIPVNLSYMFYKCDMLRTISENVFNNWDYSQLHNNSYGAMNDMFEYSYSLRNIPESFLKNIYSKSNSQYYQLTYYGFYYCYSLDEIRGLRFNNTVEMTSNIFQHTFDRCGRLKDIIFDYNEDGSSRIVKMKNQQIILDNYVGYLYSSDNILNHNSGITADKQVKNDATYQALKNDPDWWTTDVAYSRYNHDSAVRTINSLPDTSAYLATAGGTNIIKFKGESGSLTDGGAINTLTEEEIAVATAKGWTVSLV